MLEMERGDLLWWDLEPPVGFLKSSDQGTAFLRVCFDSPCHPPGFHPFFPRALDCPLKL